VESKKIWVTGSRGFIGKYLIAELRSAGYQIKCFSNAPEKDCNCHPMNYLDPVDIKEKVRLFGLPDIFIHLGWGDMAEPGSDKHLDENVRSGNNLIEAMFGSGLKKFIFAGSMNEYGARVGPLSEDMAPEGRLTNYAKGKIEVAQFGFKSAKARGKVFIHAVGCWT